MVTGLPEGKGAKGKLQDLHLHCHPRVTVAEGTLRSEASLFLYIVAIPLCLKSCSCPLIFT